MKQALIVDEQGTLEDFAATVLRLDDYRLTVVGSYEPAIQLVASSAYELVMLSHGGRCPGYLWDAVGRITETSLCRSLVIVFASEADESFHSIARRFGAVVLTAPSGVLAAADEVEQPTLS